MAFGRFAQLERERDVFVGRQVLAGEEDHLAIEPYLSDSGDRVGIQVAEVDPADLRADGGRQRSDVELGWAIGD